MSEKLKLAFYWAASCGGCDVAVLDTDEKLLEIAKIADIYFWPVAMDFKYKDIKALDKDFLDVCFFNGAVRNSEQEEIARLLREKSKLMIAFGSCACFGGIPALANLYDPEEILSWVYSGSFSTVGKNGTRPLTRVSVPEGELTLPEFYTAVYTLKDFVEVDYFLPGCPPPPELILGAVETLVSGVLPPRGSVLAPDKTVCDQCPREKQDKKVAAFRRPHEVIPDPDRCLLEQGIVCCGPGTRAGCGARCVQANMPCRGCFGPTDGVVDHGAKLAAVIATTATSKDENEAAERIGQIVDPAGTFYRFGLAASLLRGKSLKEEN